MNANGYEWAQLDFTIQAEALTKAIQSLPHGNTEGIMARAKEFEKFLRRQS